MGYYEVDRPLSLSLEEIFEMVLTLDACPCFLHNREDVKVFADFFKVWGGRYVEAYQLAKLMEDKAPFEVDLAVVEECEHILNIYEDNLKKKQYKWIEDNSIKPLLRNGDMCKYGKIAGVSEYSPASYLIYTEDENRKRVVTFEAAEVDQIGGKDE